MQSNLSTLSSACNVISFEMSNGIDIVRSPNNGVRIVKVSMLWYIRLVVGLNDDFQTQVTQNWITQGSILLRGLPDSKF